MLQYYATFLVAALLGAALLVSEMAPDLLLSAVLQGTIIPVLQVTIVAVSQVTTIAVIKVTITAVLQATISHCSFSLHLQLFLSCFTTTMSAYCRHATTCPILCNTVRTSAN